ncbi:DUF3352 domain-containing protein [Crocosphaera sp. XPORK-15E]|uniref:DUF3352 domain-containing protein n=1 Tax=Crocosphaera sp. XPORK-15E TaxID=3110247 RepID=UPI002B1FF4DD|nr:DUF3352 domain-containing protein [Crocosphaera sp. XPORK-15E]MEA5535591.1 DUF3352 domain-containing protein [Crocosphaera sp. XPORK-15E]
MSIKNKSGCGFIPVIGITAILAGSAGAYYYLQGELPFLPNQGMSPLEAVEVVPESAFASGYLSTNAQSWKNVSQYGTPDAQQKMQKNIEQWKTDSFSDKNINFEQDIQPWIDGVTFAFLAAPKTAKIDDNIKILVVVGINNKIKAAQFGKKLEQQPGMMSKEQKYQDIKIIETTQSNGDNFSWAVLGDRLILAEETDTIKYAIDTFKGNPSYAEKPGVKESFSDSLTLKNSFLQISIPNYGEMMTQVLANTPQDLPETTLKQLEKIESIFLGIGAEKEGLHLQVIANITPETLDDIPSSSAGKVLAEFPGSTLIFMNGKGIDKGWSKLLTEGSKDPDGEAFINEIRQGFSQMNLDADREVFGWLDGEFGLGIINLGRGGIANFGLGGMMLLETSDRSTGQQTLEKLNKLAQQNPSISLNQRNINNIEVTEWTVPQQGVIFSYSWLNNQNLMMSLGTSLETIKTQKEQQTLQNNPNFQSTTALLPNNNLGYFYVDINQVYTQFKAFSGSPVDPESQAIIESIQGLGMTVTFPNKTTSQLDLVLSIKSEK